MKVTTLACIQGGWIPDINPENVLDIGAGTGLLSHMVAQKFDCQIDAVEIEKDAYVQLKENTNKNPWKNKIRCLHEDILDFAKHTSKRYDFIISNPPFFSNQFKSHDRKINIARHENSLTLDSLLNVCSQLLGSYGKVSILLPPFESELLKQLCSFYSLFISDQLLISDSRGKPTKAIVSILSGNQKIQTTKKLIIKSSVSSYTPDFISLLKDYYLYM